MSEHVTSTTDGVRTDQPFQWPEWASTLEPKIGVGQQRLYSQFAEWMVINASKVWNGSRPTPFIQADHGLLRDRLRSTAESAAGELAFVDWWDRLICAGNQFLDWKIPIQAPVVRLPTDRPKYVHRDFLLLNSFRRVEELFSRQILLGVPPENLFDAVICSAIIYGGVTSTSMLGAVCSIAAADVYSTQGDVHVFLQLPFGKNEWREQRWHPDALTSVFITRAVKHQWISTLVSLKQSDSGILARVSSAFSAFEIPADSVEDLLRGARVALSLYLPPYISAYLADDFQSQSLPAAVFRHLNRWSTPASLSKAEDPRDTEPGFERSCFLTSSISFDPTKRPVDQLKAVSEVRSHLKNSNAPRVEISNLLSRQAGALWPITELLIKWTNWRLGESERGVAQSLMPKPIADSSGSRYLGAIARHLIATGESENPIEMEMEDLETLYELAAGRVKKPRELGYFWGCIRSFHTYLTFYGAPDIAFEELDGYESMIPGRVSANIVSESVFQKFKQGLLATGNCTAGSPSMMILLAAILGFRCGLRRREIQMLWLKDFHPGHDPFLIIRASALAALKSHSARRRIPVASLIPPDELALLMDHTDRRRKCFPPSSCLVFSDPNTPTVPFSDRYLFDPITEAFQTLSGFSTPQFRFHHLRHSFANRLFLALLCADNKHLLQSKATFPLESLGIKSCSSAIKEAFFPRLLGTPDYPTRRNLFLVSALLGHLSPQTTTKCYLHVLDWLAGQECDQALHVRLNGIGPHDLGVICGLSPSMPHKPPYRDSLQNPVAFFRRYVHQQLPRANRERDEDQRSIADLKPVFAKIGDAQLPGPSRLMILIALLLEKVAPEKLERDHAVPLCAIESALRNYERLYAKQSKITPKMRMPLPLPPRTRDDAAEFWRILESTVTSFKSHSNRHAMVSAAKVLIERNGPSTGNIYFGKQHSNAPTIVDGLIAMGIPANIMHMEIRTPDNVKSSKAFLQSTISDISSKGVHIANIPLDWELRRAIGEVLRLRISNQMVSDASLSLKRNVGRIKGLNFAAMWIVFAQTLIELGEVK